VSDAATEALSPGQLALENERFRGTAGASAAGRAAGFRPAFLDRATRTVYPSRYADGRAAPFHLLDGLPPSLVVSRAGDGRAAAVKQSVVSGFVRNGRFYTREQAARAAETA
jgi:hypothetical protein